jgi:hypothetical protein
MRRLLTDTAAVLEARAEHLRRGGEMTPADLDGTLAAVERDFAARVREEGEADRERLALYRELVVAVNRLMPGHAGASRT